MSESILKNLRDGTGSAHKRLEDRIQIEQRLHRMEDYAWLIEKFLGWYEPLEQKLAAVRAPAWAGSGYDLRARAKTPWLRHDLRALGYDEARIAGLPRCPDEALPAVDSAAAAFGCAYVMEGATLGGRHIAAMMQGSAVPQNARRFFNSYGPEVSDRWKEFLAALERFVAGHDASAVVEAAQEAFDSMEAWIDAEPPRT
jgi:heme oxygenase